MIKSLPSRAALILTGSAVALAAAMLPAQASAAPGWRINASFSARGAETLLTGVAAVSAGSAWSIGTTLKQTRKNAIITSVIRHWNGRAWSAVPLPSKVAKAWDKRSPIESLIAATAGNKVWAFNQLVSRTYLRLTAKGWSFGTLPGSDANLVEITAANALSANDVWVFGLQVNGNTGAISPYVVRFNGTKWARVTMPNDGGIVAAGASSSSSLWALAETEPAGSGPEMASALRQAHGSAGAAAARLSITRRTFSAPAAASSVPTVLHWGPKGGWRPAAVQPVLPAGGMLTSLLAGAKGNVWLGGAVPNSKKGTTELAASWNGKSTAWSVTTLPAAASSTQFSIVRMAAGGRGGIWAEGGNEGSSGPAARLWHLSGGKWSAVKPDFGKAWALLQLAPVPRSDSMWGVGVAEVGKSKAAKAIIAVDGPTPR